MYIHGWKLLSTTGLIIYCKKAEVEFVYAILVKKFLH